MNDFFKNFINLIQNMPEVATLFALGSAFFSILFAYFINNNEIKKLDNLIDELEEKLNQF